MGIIITSVQISNAKESSKSLQCDAMVDTGATFMVLPTAWKDRLGELEVIEKVRLETATQATVEGEICGPVRIQLDGFRSIYSEVVFVDMQPEDGVYQPLVGYIVLEQSLAGVDMIRHRLVHLKHFDLK
jgi:predicted aspartyl protease